MRGASRAWVLAAVAALAVAGCGTSSDSSSPKSSPAEVTSAVDQGVVDIVSTLGLQSGQAAGTGVVLTSSGEVLTNNHVISGATSISATDVGNGRTYQATVVGFDRSEDLAVLQLDGASGLHALTLGASSHLSVGTPVTAVGNAGGVGGTPSAASGTVTALDQTITATDTVGGSSETLSGLIAVNANLQAGDSGGPLVDANGEVVGVDTAASVGYRLQDGGGSAQGYAIPADRARQTADAIAAHQASATIHIGPTAFLGVSVTTGTTVDGTPGAEIAAEVVGGPAQSLGLSLGDVITGIQGQPVDSATALARALDRQHPGDQTTVTWTDVSAVHHSETVRLTTGPAG